MTFWFQFVFVCNVLRRCLLLSTTIRSKMASMLSKVSAYATLFSKTCDLNILLLLKHFRRFPFSCAFIIVFDCGRQEKPCKKECKYKRDLSLDDTPALDLGIAFYNFCYLLACFNVCLFEGLFLAIFQSFIRWNWNVFHFMVFFCLFVYWLNLYHDKDTLTFLLYLFTRTVSPGMECKTWIFVSRDSIDQEATWHTEPGRWSRGV